MKVRKLIDKRKAAIEKYCKKHNVSKSSLGLKYNNDAESIHYILKREPRITQALRLCEILDCKVEDLFELK